MADSFRMYRVATNGIECFGDLDGRDTIMVGNKANSMAAVGESLHGRPPTDRMRSGQCSARMVEIVPWEKPVSHLL